MVVWALLGCGPGAVDTADSDTAPAADVRPWTFAVLMNGDNNLEDYVSHDLNELEQTGSSDGAYVVVEADRIPGYATDDGDWSGARRYLIAGDDKPHVVTSPVVEDLGEVDMGDPTVLAEFLAWTIANYPSDHLAVVLWDHGNSWIGVSDDETSNSEMGVADGQLHAALAPTVAARGPIDLVAFDGCNMATFEVAHSLRDQADVMSASEAWVGWNGLEYAQALALLRDDPAIDAASLAAATADDSVDIGDELTWSAVDLTAMDGVADGVDALAQALRDDTAEVFAFDGLRRKSRAADADLHDWYVDLPDLARVASERHGAVGAAGRDLTAALDGAVINARGSAPYRWTGGLTIFAATDDRRAVDYYSRAAGASWSQATAWDDLLIDVAATEPRVEPDLAMP